MRCLGLDLGTKTLGLAISDKSNMIASPYKVLHWDGEDYEPLLTELDLIIKDNAITDLVLCYMNATLQCLSNTKKLEEYFQKKYNNSNNSPSRVRNDSKNHVKKRKKIVDSVAASVILDSYLKMKGN